jgi:hypothetical protein
MPPGLQNISSSDAIESPHDENPRTWPCALPPKADIEATRMNVR